MEAESHSFRASNHTLYFVMNNREILEQIDQLNRGIIPLSVWFNDKGGTVNELRWNSLTEDERRAAKRKFRKIWRRKIWIYTMS